MANTEEMVTLIEETRKLEMLRQEEDEEEEEEEEEDVDATVQSLAITTP